MTSIIGTPTLVDSGAYNAAYSAETGAEGVVILMAHEQTGTARYMASGTLGGQALENLFQLQQQADGSSTWIVIEAWCLKAAGIAAMSGNTIAMTAHASGNGNWKGVAYSLNDWDQTTPLVTSDTDGQFSATDLSLSVSAASGSIVIGIWAGSNGSYGTTTGKNLTDYGFTHDRVPTNTGTGYAIHTGYRVGIGSQTGAGSTVSATLDSGDPGTASAQAAAILVFPTAASGATISSGTPSGTIATQRRVTLGATSTQSTGTFYGVVSATQGDITGITAAQVYAGQYAGGGAATFAGNNTVSDSTPDLLITGLTPATTYYYAVMHRVGTNNSNVISTGSFTTAVATSTATLTLRDSGGTLLNAQTLNFWTRTGLNAVAADGGSSGLSVTCDASGVFSFTGLSVDAGAGFLTVQNPSDNTYSANYPVTFVAGT